QLEQGLAVRLGHVLVADLGSHGGTGLGLSFEAVTSLVRYGDHGLELEVGQALPDAIDELRVRALERFVVRCAGVPAVGPSSLLKCPGMLHERNTLSLERLCDQQVRHVGCRSEPRK